MISYVAYAPPQVLPCLAGARAVVSPACVRARDASASARSRPDRSSAISCGAAWNCRKKSFNISKEPVPYLIYLLYCGAGKARGTFPGLKPGAAAHWRGRVRSADEIRNVIDEFSRCVDIRPRAGRGPDQQHRPLPATHARTHYKHRGRDSPALIRKPRAAA
eukprot:5480696-Pleurochrysis_carterae.AAC.1